jgi:hypothetical protein
MPSDSNGPPSCQNIMNQTWWCLAEHGPGHGNCPRFERSQDDELSVPRLLVLSNKYATEVEFTCAG